MSDITVEAHWEGELRFATRGKAGVPVVVDGDRKAGPSPMEMLLTGLATCMGADLVEILNRMHVPFTALRVRAEGDRRPKAPRRYTVVRLVYETEGIAEEHGDKLQRAIDLSRDRYCSVLHTLQPDLDLTIRIDRG